MVKYIFKESELRATIDKIVTEEVSRVLNEGLGHALGSALKNTAKIAVKGTLAPGLLANDALEKTNNIFNGDDTVTKTVRNFFGADTSSSNSGGVGLSRKSKAEKQRERMSSARGISFEYGRPETVPDFGHKFKLARKSEIVAPQSQNGISWGKFGKHYHDEGDRMWNRKVQDTENAFIRNSRNASQGRIERLQRRYKRVLIDWLKERDREYKIYIKNA